MSLTPNDPKLLSKLKGIMSKDDPKPEPRPKEPVKAPESSRVIKTFNPKCRPFDISIDDVAIIQTFEGHKLTAYPDPATKGDPWTISWGLTGSWVKPGLTITQEESEKKFMEYLERFCKEIDLLLKMPLSKNQYVAILSFCWNLGVSKWSSSTLKKKLDVGDFNGAAGEFTKWSMAGGTVLPGLLRRREAERSLFLKKDAVA